MTNTISKIGLVVAGAVLAVASYAAIATTQVDAKGRPGANNGTIVDIATGEMYGENFETLVAALTCTVLADQFAGNRQFTVFAPTDAAFTKTLGVDASTVCDVDEATLKNILKYHVTPGVKTSQTVLNRSSMNMLNRQMAPIEGTSIGGADLNTSLLDLRATNGVVHVLNEVMIP